MKKLMTMIAAIAAGVMAYGDTTYASTGFEDPSEFAEGVLATGGETGWSTTDTGATLTKGVYDGDAYTGTRNPAFASAANANYLSVKTTFGKPLERALDVAVDKDSVYFDQLVKMTAVDEPPSVDGYGAKIVIYAQDMTEAETPSAVTNLYAVAGRYVNGVLSTDTYCLGEIDITQWHRLTIKTIKAYNNSAVAFEVFVDGVARAYTENKAYDSASGLTTAAQALNAAKKLLPSMVAAATIVAVGFDGQGAIDDLVATTALPGEWAQDKNITLEFDEHVTSVTYTAHGAQTTATDSPAVIPWASDMTVTLNNVVYAQNWALDEITGTGISVNGNEISVTADNAAIMIKSKDVTPRMAIEINGEAAGTAPSFAAALATIKALPSGTAKITLNENITLGTTTYGDFQITEATVTGNAAVTIDLNGKTITGPAECAGGYTIDSTTAGGLTITDSSALKEGKVLSSNVGAVNCYNSNLTIDAGTFEGAVVVEGATSLVSGGKFLKGEEEAFALTLANGCKATLTEGYWVIGAKAKATVAVTTTHATIEGVVDGATPYVGDVLEFTAAAAENYENVVVTINGKTVSAPYSYTVTEADATVGVAISATATPIEWTITYMIDEGTQFATDTYTIENRGTKELNAGTRDGYSFVRWSDLEGNPIESLAEMTGDLTLYGEWESKTYVAQIGENKYESLAAAVAAAKNGDTVTVLADITTTEAIAIAGSNKADYAITIKNDYNVTWTADAVTQKYAITVNGATVTFTGTGTWTKTAGTASLVQAGATAAADIIVTSGTFVGGTKDMTGSSAPSNLITSKWGDITVNGGTFVNYRADQGRCVRAEGSENGNSTLTVNDGTFEVRCDGTELEAIASRHVAVDNKGLTTGSVVINGGKFKTPEQNVNEIMNAYCGAGYKLKADAEGWLVKTAIVYATLTVNIAEQVSGVVVKAGEAVVKSGDKFDVDEAVVVTADLTDAVYAKGYEADADNSVYEVTMTGNATITVAAKKSTYAITVTDGTADKTSYQISDVAQTVTLTAGNAPEGQKFKQWKLTEKAGVSIAGNTLTIAADTIGEIAVAAEFEDEQTDLPGAGDVPAGNKAAYNTWAQKNGVVAGDTAAGADLATAWAMGVDGASGAAAIEAAAQDMVTKAVTQALVDAIVAGDTTAQLKQITTELSKNATVTVTLKPVTLTGSDANLFKLVVTITK